MSSVNNRSGCSPFERLPTSLVGHTIDFLNWMTGSFGIVTSVDIPVIIRKIRCLASTSRSMYTHIRSEEVIRTLLKSLSLKYNQPPENFAVLLPAKSAQKWLWNYIDKKNGYGEAYQIIQAIYHVGCTVLQEAKNEGLTDEDDDFRPEMLDLHPNAYYGRTKQGFVFCHDQGPSHLATPFGKMPFTAFSSGRFSGIAASEVLIRRLNAVFAGMDLAKGEQEIHEIEASSESLLFREISPQDKKKISVEELESKKGTQNVIEGTSYENCSAYDIRNVGKELVPAVKWFAPDESQLSYEAIKRIWEMLEDRRKKNLGLELSSLDPPSSRHTPVASNRIEKPLFKNVLEVGSSVIELLRKLEDQSISSEGGGKRWSLTSLDYAQLIQALNNLSSLVLSKGLDRLILPYVDRVKSDCGIELWRRPTSCDLNALQQAYDSVIQNISQNWIQSELKDYPNILHPQSEEDYLLFIKKEKIMNGESDFISRLASQLGLSNSIHCSNSWKNKDSSAALYLWIKKEKVDEVLKAFNIPPSSSAYDLQT